MKYQTPHWSSTALILFSIVVVGACAGTIASVMTSRSLDRYVEQMSGQDSSLLFSEVKPEPIPGTYEEALRSVSGAYQYLAYLYPANTETADSDDWVYDEDALATGVVVTSDGWILFDADSLTSVNTSNASMYIHESWFDVTNVIFDTKEQVALVRVDASGLSAVTFGYSSSAQEGEMVFAPSKDLGLSVASLVSVQNQESSVARAAEYHTDVWTLQDEIESGLPIFDSSGRLIAMSQSEGEALPLHRIEGFVKSVLADGAPMYAALGCYGLYVDAALNKDTDSLGTEHGFFVTGTYAQQAIVWNGPAAKAGLQEGDVLITIDGVDITQENQVADIVLYDRAGDELRIGYVRDGQERETTLTLGDFDLLY
jgi:serine protease Do